MFFGILSAVLGILLFLFLFWNKQREDYPSGQIFTTAFYILIGIAAGYLISRRIYPQWWFWEALAGLAAGFGLGIFRFKFRFYEAFESLVIAILPWLSLVFLADSISSLSYFSFAAFVVIVALMGLYHFLDKHYKSFSWYRSGRIGFSGLTVAGVFFLIRAAVAFNFAFVLSFVVSVEAILSGVAAFILFLLTFNLARSET
jgi:hypothetical protein